VDPFEPWGPTASSTRSERADEYGVKLSRLPLLRRDGQYYDTPSVTIETIVLQQYLTM
jgi:hypothetical protein